MIITLDQIHRFSKSLNYFLYSEREQPCLIGTHKQHIVIRLIKQCYLTQSKQGIKPAWHTITEHINKECFFNIDVADKEAFNKAYKLSLEVMTIMHYWWTKYFKKDDRTGFINIPVSTELSNNLIKHTFDLLLIDNNSICLIIFIDKEYPDLYLKYDTMHWLIYKEFGQLPSFYEVLTVKENSVQIEREEYSLSKNIENYIYYLSKGIENSKYICEGV